jgi:hypothetical protein
MRVVSPQCQVYWYRGPRLHGSRLTSSGGQDQELPRSWYSCRSPSRSPSPTPLKPRLVDVLPEDQVGAIGEVLRAAVAAGLTGEQAHRLAERLRAHSDSARLAAEPVRTFASAGTLSRECKYLLERLPGPLLIPATVATEVCILLERRRGTYAASVRQGWRRSRGPGGNHTGWDAR